MATPRTLLTLAGALALATAAPQGEAAAPTARPAPVAGNGSYSEPEYRPIQRPPFGAAAGIPADTPAAVEAAEAGRTLQWVFAGLTAATLAGTAGAAYGLSAITGADGRRRRSLTVGAKLSLAMGGMATLLAGVGAVVLTSQADAADREHAFEQVAAETGVLEALQRSVLRMRITVYQFLETSSDRSLADYSAVAATARALLDLASEHADDEQLRAALASTEADLRLYDDAMKSLVAAIDERDAIFESQFIPATDRLMDLASGAAGAASLAGDPAFAFAIEHALADIDAARMEMMRYLRSGDPRSAEEAIRRSADGSAALAALAGQAADTDQGRMLAEAAEAAAYSARRIERLMALQDDRDRILHEVMIPTGARIMETGADGVAAMQAETAERRAGANAAAARTSALIAAVVGAALVGATIANTLFVRGLTGGISRLVAVVQRIAAGDLTVEKTGSTATDELGELSRASDAMLDSLRALVKEVAAASQEVAAASAEIAASAQQMAAGIRSQEEQTVQVSAAVEQMAASVQEVAARSADSANRAEDAGRTARTGGEQIQTAASEMTAIADNVRQTSDAIAELGRRSEQIGEIIAVIDDIADQTNLLALNAAIEAARAGEHGRGFAVVADEVRKLAERTTEATRQVADSVRSIQTETGAAVEKVASGAERAARGMDLARSAGDALEAILTASSEVSEMIASIAAAAEEQAAASEQISRSVDAVAAVGRESAAGAAQSAAAAEQLSRKSEELNLLVSRFRLS